MISKPEVGSDVVYINNVCLIDRATILSVDAQSDVVLVQSCTTTYEFSKSFSEIYDLEDYMGVISAMKKMSDNIGDMIAVLGKRAQEGKPIV